MASTRITPLSVLLALVASGLASAAEPPAGGSDPTRHYQPLSPISQCLIPERVRDWAYVSDTRILVNAGRRRYRITFSYGCPALAFGTFIRFQPGPGIGRMCGYVNEKVTTRDSACHVAGIELIDRATWDEVISQPGVSLQRHVQDREPAGHLVDRQRQELDVSRSR